MRAALERLLDPADSAHGVVIGGDDAFVQAARTGALGLAFEVGGAALSPIVLVGLAELEYTRGAWNYELDVGGIEAADAAMSRTLDLLGLGDAPMKMLEGAQPSERTAASDFDDESEVRYERETVPLRPREPGELEPPDGPAFLAFERPDGKVRWGIAANAPDYVARLESGEYTSRTLPAGTRFRTAVPTVGRADVDALREELNWDPELSGRAAAAVEAGSGGDASSDDPRERAIALLVAASLDDHEVVSRLAAALAVARRERKPPRPRKRNPIPRLKALTGAVEIELVEHLATPCGAAAHVGETAWLFCWEEVVVLDSGGERLTLPQSAIHIGRHAQALIAPDGAACAVFSRGQGELVRREASSVALSAGGTPVTQRGVPEGVLAGMQDGRVVGWDWQGLEMFRSEAFGHVDEVTRGRDMVVARTGEGSLKLLDPTSGHTRRSPRPLPKATAIGRLGDDVAVCTGDEYETLGSEAVVALSGWQYQTRHDAADRLVGWADRELLSVVDETGVTSCVPHRRSLTGRATASVAVGDQLILSFGRIGSGSDHGIDVHELASGALTHELTVPRSAEVQAAWHVGGDRFRVVVGAAVLDVQAAV